MSYIALYREWRPKVFSDIIGQEHITKTLKNQISQGRIAHAYLFCGTRGTGKTTTAKVFAKAVNCLEPIDFEPCGKCETCRGIEDGSIMDVYEIDAASNNGVDNIRDLRDDVKYAPSICKYKVYIIDEVHMLSTAAFNALLKTLEEPPAHVIFILATTEYQKVPATILSRCQRFDFKRIKTSDIVGRLKTIAEADGIDVEERTLKLIARNSDGALRDALSIFDQCISIGGKGVKYDDVISILGITTDEYLIRITDSIAEEDAAECIAIIDELVTNGKDIYQFIKDLTMHFRNLLVCSVGGRAEDILNTSDEMFEELSTQAKKFGTEAILRNINILSDAESSAKWAANQRIILEMAVMKMTKKELRVDVESLQERVANLEKIIESGGNPKTTHHDKKETTVGTKTPANTKDVEKPKDIKTKNDTNTNTNISEPPTAEDTKGGLSLKDINAKWAEILNTVKSNGHIRLYAFLIEGKPIGFSNNVLSIGFDKEYKFHKENVENAENIAIVEKTVSDMFNTEIKARCAIIDEIAADKQEDSFIKDTIDIFGGDIVEVEE